VPLDYSQRTNYSQLIEFIRFFELEKRNDHWLDELVKVTMMLTRESMGFSKMLGQNTGVLNI